MRPHHTKTKGDLAVAKALADLSEQGFVVLLPLTEHAPFDLVAYAASRFVRVQVKYRTAVRGCVRGNTDAQCRRACESPRPRTTNARGSCKPRSSEGSIPPSSMRATPPAWPSEAATSHTRRTWTRRETPCAVASLAVHGGRSSVWLERRVVVAEVGGSSPLGHPTSTPAPGMDRRGRGYPPLGAPLAQRQSNGLLIRRFWVRIPGGALRRPRSTTGPGA